MEQSDSGSVPVAGQWTFKIHNSRKFFDPLHGILLWHWVE